MDMSNPVQLHTRTPITWLAVKPHMNDMRKQRINLIKQTKKKIWRADIREAVSRSIGAKDIALD